LPSCWMMLHGSFQLVAAVAAKRPEDVARQALAVDADEDGVVLADLALDQGQVGVLLDVALIGHGRELAVARRQVGLAHGVDQGIELGAVADERLDGGDLQAVLAANASRSGMRAMLPSSRMISQMTAAGLSPASGPGPRCPRSGRPARARRRPRPQGEDVPRRGRCPRGRRVGRHAVRMVVARSYADMPVVTPALASMDTVNAVPNLDWFLAPSSGAGAGRHALR
jgi:hypothetical protein